MFDVATASVLQLIGTNSLPVNLIRTNWIASKSCVMPFDTPAIPGGGFSFFTEEEEDVRVETVILTDLSLALLEEAYALFEKSRATFVQELLDALSKPLDDVVPTRAIT